MADTIKSNLEPIDEKDLDLKSKFSGSSENGIPNIEKPMDVPINKEVFPMPEKEPAKEIISAEKDSAYNKILSKVKTQTSDDTPHEEVKSDAEKVYKKQDAESQIQHLVDIATNKGVIHAVKVARHLEDNYVLDMFHDKLLSDELHDALMKRGMIEEI
ncbi:MAG: hypothetical protein V1804_03375 [Patescibacteria group bacterium]